MRMGAIVLDTDNSEELADFYRRLLGWTKECQVFEGEKWFVVKSADGEGLPLVFQEVEEYKKPRWPACKGFQPQMAHVDFYVQADELENEIKHAISCGAVFADAQLTESWKVMLDPAGHPFCIIPLPAE